MAFDFISPTRPDELAAYESKYDFTKLPRPYAKHGALSEHLENAIMWDVIEFELQCHTNQEKGPLNCICYYTDDIQNANAVCHLEGDTYFIFVNMFLVRRLVLICHRIGKILDRRPRTGSGKDDSDFSTIRQDPVLYKLLLMDSDINEQEIKEVVASWPDARTQSAQMELGEYAIFYDFIRIIWVHEWAHAACGHVAFGAESMGFAGFTEISPVLEKAVEVPFYGYREHEVIQAFEIHADEFSIVQNLRKILWGVEPILGMAGPRIDITDRLVMLNIAFCIFCVWVELEEQKMYPGLSFKPSDNAAFNHKYGYFTPYPTLHPPAALRYLRFRSFQRLAATQYNEQLSYNVDPISFSVVEMLAAACSWFYRLMPITPMFARTPTMKQLQSYEEYLVMIENSFIKDLQQKGYPPRIVPVSNGEV